MAKLPLENISVVNLVALDQTIRAAVPSFTGATVANRQLILLFTDNATAEEMNDAKQIALAHDPKVLAPDQIINTERADRIAALSAEVEADKGKPPTVASLMKRIELLELERNA